MSDNLETMFLATLRGILVEIATFGKDSYITVPDIQKRINILPTRGRELAELVNGALWRIAEAEHSLGHPMLTALVVKQQKPANTIMAGDGFFKCAEKLGIYNGSTDDNDRDEFWRQEFKAVHDYWKIPRPNKR